MMTPRKKILMLCVNYWTSCYQVGSHHLARAFAEAGWDVAFLSSPITPLNLARFWNPELHDRLSIYRAGGDHDLDNRLWTDIPFALLTPDMLSRRWVYTHWAKTSFPNIVRKLNRQGFGNPDLVYIDNVRMAGLLQSINCKQTVYRIADDNTAFPGHNTVTQTIERELVQSAGLVIYSSETLRPRVEAMNPKQALHVPNGVQYAHFAARDTPMPPDYHAIPKPIAVYVGALEFWFDFDLIEAAANRLPHISFVLIGPPARARQRLGHLTNITILGSIKHADLPPYLHHADVGLLPFNVSGYPDLIHAANPLKLYEYFASGIPAVATEWDELNRLQTPAALCRTSVQFAEAVSQAVTSPPDRERLQEFARSKDWKRITSNLFEWFEQHNFFA